MVRELTFETQKNDVLSLTEQIEAVVAESGVQEGLCVIHSPHTTAGITITSKWDETGWADIKSEMRRIVPTRVDFATSSTRRRMRRATSNPCWWAAG